MDLSELGLTGNENKVYDLLINHGKLTAGVISAKSGVPYGRIYEVLNSLINKGFCELIPDKTKKYSAVNPKTLINMINSKEEQLKKLKEEANKLKQFYESKDKDTLVVGEGRTAFYKLIQELKGAEKYSYSIKWSAEYRDDWVESRRKKIKKGIDIKDLVRYDDETRKSVKKWLKLANNLRQIENDGVAISIIDDEEILISLIKSSRTLIIRDKPFVKIMKELFLSYYKQAEQIK